MRRSWCTVALAAATTSTAAACECGATTSPRQACPLSLAGLAPFGFLHLPVLLLRSLRRRYKLDASASGITNSQAEETPRSNHVPAGQSLTCPLCRGDWGDFKWRPVAIPKRKKPHREAGGIQGSTHHGTKCAGCRASPIQGKRFRCLVCAELSLCEECFQVRLPGSWAVAYISCERGRENYGPWPGQGGVRGSGGGGKEDGAQEAERCGQVREGGLKDGP